MPPPGVKDDIFVKLNILFINFQLTKSDDVNGQDGDPHDRALRSVNLTGNYSKLIHVYGFQITILYCLCEKRYICKILSLNTT